MSTREAEPRAPRMHPISVVSLGMWGDGGKPIPRVESAICDVCGAWAETLYTAAKDQGNGSLTDVRISRHCRVVVYACTEHAEQISGALCDEFGYSTNWHEPDELAQEVHKRGQRV